MKLHGLTIDEKAIGAGIYAMICDKGEEGLVAFGMIPAWAVDAMREALRPKLIAEAAKAVACEPAEIAPYLDEEKLKRIMNAIERAVCTEIYGAAKAAGKMVV